MLIVRKKDDLTTETVQSPPLSLQSVDDIERGDGLPLGMLGVCDGISDNALEEGLEDQSGLFVDPVNGMSVTVCEVE